MRFIPTSIFKVEDGRASYVMVPSSRGIDDQLARRARVQFDMLGGFDSLLPSHMGRYLASWLLSGAMNLQRYGML
jgi:hypothetical protein